MTDATKNTEQQLLRDVRNARESGGVVSATLKTDERVFARITDGIYREPSSALRELIANAYDADATEVRIETDAPRFSRIVVRDNGHGLTEEALIHVICHIGGSLKRTEQGREFNVVSEGDPTLSPAGRKLIGKLGIGLFSVSQLTHHLVIVTKVKGEALRRVCDILLMPQSDLPRKKGEDGADNTFVTGKVQIKTIPAEDVSSQGTEITLLDIRSFVRESLQSKALWTAIAPQDDDDPLADTSGKAEAAADATNDVTETDEEQDPFYEPPPVPSFHIGRVDFKNPDMLIQEPVLPWDANDASAEKFRKLVAGVRSLSDDTKDRIKLSEVLDTYLRTLWTLSLSVPVPYVAHHPFDLTGDDGVPVFAISNQGKRPTAQTLELKGDESIRTRVGFVADSTDDALPFEVIVDGISLRRPLEFPSPAHSASGVPPLLFIGKMKSEMDNLPDDYSGGPLEFEAYFYWQHRVVPADHNGLLIRINGASGILFDDHFLKYQIAELTRLRQLTAEIFIVRGLDAALNIDRESFNIAHTHYQVLRKWVHHALRQVMSRHKAVSGTVSATRLAGGLSAAVKEITEIVREGIAPQTAPVAISFSDSPLLRKAESGLVFDRTTVFSARKGKRAVTKSDRIREELLEQQIKAVAAVLQEYRLFDSLDDTARDALLKKIVAIFSVDIKK